MPRKPHVPTYRHHKPSGQAVVTITGKDCYLGLHDSPESYETYRRLIAEHLSGVPTTIAAVACDLTINEILDRYWTHAKGYYLKSDGSPGTQLSRIKAAFKPLRALYGSTEARKFGPNALRAVRAQLIPNHVRKIVNQMVGCIRLTFKWAASYEMIPASVPHALATVEGLREGRSDARESEPVEPVPVEHIEAVRPLVLPTVRDLIDLQLLTGCRPGEILQLQDVDLDRTGKVWIVRKRKHKNRWRGHERQLLIGPKGQAIVETHLSASKASPYYLFSAREAVQAHYRTQGRKYRVRFGRAPGEFYGGTSYTHAISRACKKAGVEPWHPHQLRHNAATYIRAEFGPDVARAVLGQRSLKATEIYAELDMQKAIEAIEKVG